MNATAELRVKRLVAALSDVSKPLDPLLEYADDLSARITDGDDMGVLCIAALLRAKAGAAKREMSMYLDAVEDAANSIAISSSI